MAGDHDMPEKDGRHSEAAEPLFEVVTEFAGIRLTSRIQITVQPSSVTIRLDEPLLEIDGDVLDE